MSANAIIIQITIAPQNTSTDILQMFSTRVHFPANEYKQKSIDTNGGYIIGKIHQIQGQRQGFTDSFLFFN